MDNIPGLMLAIAVLAFAFALDDHSERHFYLEYCTQLYDNASAIESCYGRMSAED